MTDREKVLEGLKCCANGCSEGCPYFKVDECDQLLSKEALELLKEQEKEIKALHLLVERAEECDFDFDQFPDEYERYKDEIKNMKYIDGMIHVAKERLKTTERLKKGS